MQKGWEEGGTAVREKRGRKGRGNKREVEERMKGDDNNASLIIRARISVGK